jgi:hypothetical protein
MARDDMCTTRRPPIKLASAGASRATRRAKIIALADARARGAHTELDAERAAENDRNDEIFKLPDPNETNAAPADQAR